MRHLIKSLDLNILCGKVTNPNCWSKSGLKAKADCLKVVDFIVKQAPKAKIER